MEHVIKLLQYAYVHGYKQECAALVLVFFCGVRVDEVHRASWEHVKLADDAPVIVLDETRANRRRVNPIPPNAVAWLKELSRRQNRTNHSSNHGQSIRIPKTATRSAQGAVTPDNPTYMLADFAHMQLLVKRV